MLGAVRTVRVDTLQYRPVIGEALGQRPVLTLSSSSSLRARLVKMAAPPRRRRGPWPAR